MLRSPFVASIYAKLLCAFAKCFVSFAIMEQRKGGSGQFVQPPPGLSLVHRDAQNTSAPRTRVPVPLVGRCTKVVQPEAPPGNGRREFPCTIFYIKGNMFTPCLDHAWSLVLCMFTLLQKFKPPFQIVLDVVYQIFSRSISSKTMKLVSFYAIPKITIQLNALKAAPIAEYGSNRRLLLDTTVNHCGNTTASCAHRRTKLEHFHSECIGILDYERTRLCQSSRRRPLRQTTE